VALNRFQSFFDVIDLLRHFYPHFRRRFATEWVWTSSVAGDHYFVRRNKAGIKARIIGLSAQFERRARDNVIVGWTFTWRFYSASEMTYIVSSGALNSTHSLCHDCLCLRPLLAFCFFDETCVKRCCRVADSSLVSTEQLNTLLASYSIASPYRFVCRFIESN